MRTLTAAAAAVLTLAACATTPAAEQSSPPLRHVAIAALPDEPAHDDELPMAKPPGPADRSDPAAVAVDLIVAGLAEQGSRIVQDDGVWWRECQLTLMHNRLGQSPGFSVRHVCTVCSGDPITCTHAPGSQAQDRGHAESRLFGVPTF